EFNDLPELAIKTLRPAMQRVGAVVGIEADRRLVEHEARSGDSVGVAPDRGAEEFALREIAVAFVVPEDDIGAMPVAIGDLQRLQRGTEGNDCGLKAVAATQSHALDH